MHAQATVFARTPNGPCAGSQFLFVHAYRLPKPYPFLANCLGETNNASLRNGIIDLSDVTVETSSRRNIDDASVLSLGFLLDAHVGCSLAYNAEWRNIVALDDRSECLVISRVYHLAQVKHNQLTMKHI